MSLVEAKVKLAEMRSAHKTIMRALWAQKTIAPATSPELVEAARVMLSCEKQLEEFIKEKEREQCQQVHG